MKNLTLFGAALLAVLATVGVADAQLNLVPNGDFETADGAGWVTAGGGAVFSWPTTGGNGDGGYGDMDSSAGWGVLVAEVDSTNGLDLASLGLVAGQSYDFQFDMIGFAGGESAGIKLEGWAAGADVGNSGDLKSTATTSWATYTENWMIPTAATSIKFVPLSVDGGHVGFDNVGVVVTSIPEPGSLGLIALGMIGLVARRRRS